MPLIVPGKKFRELLFMRFGQVAVHNEKGQGPFFILPQSSWVGDYQILFNLKSNALLKVMPGQPREVNDDDSDDNPEDNMIYDNTEEAIFSCINEKKFLQLCELYPATMMNLKIRALDRRQRFLDQMNVPSEVFGQTFHAPKPLFEKVYNKKIIDDVISSCSGSMSAISREKLIDFNKVKFLPNEIDVPANENESLLRKTVKEAHETSS
jgi:hypothetical protein